MIFGIRRLLGRLNAYVWDDDLRDLAGLRKLLVFVLRVLHMLLRELMGGQLNLRAMSLVYTTLLSIVPLLAVSFSVLKGFGVHNKIEVLLYNLLTPLGPSGVEITDKIVSFVENVRVGVLGSIGFALLIYTVIALLQKIEAAFNFVWQIDSLRALSQRFSNYLSVILIGPVLIFSAVGFTATVLNMDVAQRLAAIEPFGTLMLFGSKLVPYVLVCLAFTLIYIFIPNTRVQFKAALIGGVIAGVIWKITGWGFAAFIASSSKYAAIYSSFAIMILLLIWMYLSWLILLVGSQIAYFVQHPRYMTLHREPVMLSNRIREQLALQLMYLVGYNHFHNKPAWSLDQLIEYLDLPGEPLHRVMRMLVDDGYLIEVVRDDALVYLPLHDIETIRLVDVITDVRTAQENQVVSLQHLTPLKAVDTVMAGMDSSRIAALGEQTLRSLVESVDDQLEASLKKLAG
ncbi:MAG: YihY/virulence factor BrkB family protein [Gammaproteobacteria bacterium]|nr:YihY/virulence factor BrkB family protein [Gammaproteobacteria bacterium]MDH3985901.1 YihY/virulence factor BrkB family protein [Gammaproteobacteria bacterium]